MEYLKKLFKKPETKLVTEETEKKCHLNIDDIKQIFIEQFTEFKKSLPDSQCFVCRTMMYGHKLGHAEHLFCSEECLKEFRRIRDYHDPLVTKKTIKGEDVKVIK